ncbi:hypothetical protein GVX82_05225 [Patescibacteria group bacterium]|jgi:hypothetical protein|nr:hypothetical protein [Patescibacteria group bacterium]
MTAAEPSHESLATRLRTLLAEASLPEEVRTRFAEILIKRSTEDLTTIVDALAEDPQIAEYLVRDLALKYRYKQSGDTNLIATILRNQEEGADVLNARHHV